MNKFKGFHATYACHPPKKTIWLFVLCLICMNLSQAQTTIAQQQFNNGSATGQITIAPQYSSTNVTTHIGADDWDYTATSTNGVIRVVNSSVTTPASNDYCLEFKSYWDNEPNIVLADQDISLFNNVTFSIAYHSLGEPENNEDLWLDYSYYQSGAWVDTSIRLINATNNNSDALAFGVDGTYANPYVVSIPDAATAFRATIRADFQNASGGHDNYYIDDLILEGTLSITPPQANCNDISITLDAFDNATITTADIDNGSTVDSGAPMLSIDKANFTCTDIGTNTVTLTVEDSYGFTDSCTATVTVNPYTGTLIAPTLPAVTAYCDYTSAAQTISYQCRTITPTTNDPLTFTAQGSYTINWLYYDSVTGNSATAVENITIAALAAPTNIGISDLEATSATVTWDALTAINSYEVQYREVGITNWNSVLAPGNTWNLSGLRSNTDYELQVSAICNGSNSAFSSLFNFTTPDHVYCIPNVPNTNAAHYINRVRFGSLAQDIDNSSGYDNGYGDYTTSIADVYIGSTETIRIDVNKQQTWMDVGFAVWIDLNNDGDFTDAGEDIWFRGSPASGGVVTGTSVTGNFTIPNSATPGQTRMRIAFRNWWHPTDPCDGTFDSHLGEFEDYTVNLLIDPTSPGEIAVLGNGNNIDDGAALADATLDNGTDFAVYDIFEGTITRLYTITNNGGQDLNLTGSPVIQISGSTDFTVTQPTDAVLSIGESTTFTISYNPSTLAVHQATVSIDNDDADEDPFTFVVRGEGVQSFPDTDGDGITDNVDIDDDNDGILDTLENSSCSSSSNATLTEVVFFNETFGANAGTRVEIDAFNIGVRTSYCYEDGSGTGCPTTNFNTTSLNDGEYTVYHQIANGDGVNQTPIEDIAQWADNFWYLGEDHTPGDVDGRMAIFNADENPGIFFEADITGVTPNVPITYGFSALNIDRTDAPDVASRLRPEVQIIVFDPNGNQIATATSGAIEPTSPAGDWVDVTATFTTSFTQFTVQLVNSQLGGIGNDLAIDDIFVKQLLCDSDGDGISDTVDLDNDNDGIPNVVELNLPDNDKDATLFNDPVVTWADTNNNGMHDLYESITIPDSDNDGTPDYIDLDSDNDGIFDSVEYDGLGDSDVNGDGIGEGDDKDDDDPSTEADGDGILPMMDLNDDGVGNDHGSTNYPDPADSDSDGTPDYLDVDSNDPTDDPSNGTDISGTILAYLDADNDGDIDGTTDVDEDGILDVFDSDTNYYGSPRDYDDKYTLFFDGRNDYVEDDNVINSGDASLMAFIRVTGSNATSSARVVVGQQNFYITVNTDNTVSVSLNGATVLTSATAITDQIWAHVAATTTSGKTALFINGEEIGSDGSGPVNLDTSNLTIGRISGADANYFTGELEEVRVFSKALTEEELKRMVYQELDDTNGFDRGQIVPYDISTGLGASLVKYYKMDAFKDDILDDKTTATVDENTGAKIYNIKNIYPQTAPLPYETTADGNWTNSATWLHGDVWDITNTATNKDWSIVHIKNNVNTSSAHNGIGLLVDAGSKLEVTSDVAIQNSWYLNLNGEIDLQGEAQLVQTATSTIVAGTNGRLERDQQGTRNLYTYNYWSSPVHSANPNANIDGDETYTLANVMMDGTDASNPIAINFISGVNGNGSTTPIQLAERWVWKFVNSLDDDYSQWQQVFSTGSLTVGEGFTLKGPSTDPIASFQNYVFRGVPNNGTISLGINGGNNYLVGNPYPSAIDGNEVINDNTNLNGTLYFWEHYGGNSHALEEYQGGYGLYNLSGGTPAIADADVDSGGTALKTPRRYIPVGQGFFVVADSDGSVTFENDQRIFVTEAGNTNSWFYRSDDAEEIVRPENQQTEIPQDVRPKFRIKYHSPENYERHLLLTIDENASPQFDWGYDGALIEDHIEDMSWLLNGGDYAIQGINEVNESTVLPLRVKTQNGGIIEISIYALENVADDVDIFVEDMYNGTYHNLRQNNYLTTVTAGTISDRFRIVFEESTLSVNEFEIAQDVILHYNTNTNSIIIRNPKRHTLDTLSIHNLLGQSLLQQEINTSQPEIKVPMSLQTGVYVFTIQTEGTTITKKQIINN